MTGAAPRESLLDLRELFSEDAKAEARARAAAGRRRPAVLTQVCARCHDGRENPLLSRNLFNVKTLDQMSREEKDLAIARLQEPEGSVLRMPPWRAATLPPAELAAAIQELSK